MILRNKAVKAITVTIGNYPSGPGEPSVHPAVPSPAHPGPKAGGGDDD